MTSKTCLMALAIALCLSGSQAAFGGQPMGEITIVKDAMPNDVQDFFFTGLDDNGATIGGAQLDDDTGATNGNGNLSDRKTFALPEGAYRFREDQMPAGWTLAGITCNPAGSSNVNLATRTVTLKVIPGVKMTCTFVNRKEVGAEKGTVTVRKVLIPAGDPGRFNLQVAQTNGTVMGSVLNVGNNGLLNQVTVPTGNYIVGEQGGTAPPTSLSNYISTISGAGCAPNGAVTVTPNANIVCTITNRRRPTDPEKGTVSVRKVLIPAGDPGRFHLQVAQTNGTVLGSVMNVGNNGLLNPVTVQVGTYVVSELGGTAPPTSLSNYNTTISGAGCNPNGTVTVTANANIVCTITNRRIDTPQKGTVSVRKTLIPAGDPGRFHLQVAQTNGTVLGSVMNVGNNGVLNPVSVPVGTYVVSELGGTAPPTSLSNYNITITGAGCNPNGTVTVTPNANIVCTIVNRRIDVPQKGTVSVRKVLIPAGDPGRFHLQVAQTNGTVLGSVLNVGNNGVLNPVSVNVGTYVVSELGGTAPPTSLSNYSTIISGAGCNPNGTVTVTPGANIVCTITNRRVEAQVGRVTIRKVLVPATDPGRFHLQLNLPNGSNVGNVANVGNNGLYSNTAVPVGNYVVAEAGGNAPATSLANYITTITGTGCAPNGAITVTAGATINCVITNTRRDVPAVGRLTVRKVLVPAADPGRFHLTVTASNGTSMGTLPNAGNGGTLANVAVPPGTYTVGELGGNAPATNLGDYTAVITGAGCAPNGTVVITTGANITCTITNTRKTSAEKGTVSIRKVIVPANDPGRFHLQLLGPGNNIIASTQNAGNNGVLNPVSVAVGTYAITEIGGNAPATSMSDYIPVISGAGCNPNGTVTVTANANIVCTITNTRRTVSTCTGYPLNVNVNVYNPMQPFGPQTVDICRGGKVTFTNVNSGVGWIVGYLSGPQAFAPVPLAAANGSTGQTAVLNSAGAYQYRFNGVNGAPGIQLPGNIVVH